MMRTLAVLLAVTMPAASPPAAPAGDRVRELAGSWTCRNPIGSLSTIVYRAENGGLVATEAGAPGEPVIAHDVLRPEPAGGWHVERSSRYTKFTGYGPAWTSGTWRVADANKHGAEIHYESIDDRTLRRTFVMAGRPYAGEVCAKGEAPPAPALCAVADIPATASGAVMPDAPVAVTDGRSTGRVDVLVSLDATGRVSAAAIKQSQVPALNGAALAAARESTYRPALHDCKPVPSQYLFTVQYRAR
jgi:hypothetical protein